MSVNTLPDISSLPLWAQILCYGVVGVSMATVFIISSLGFLKGKSEGPMKASDAPKAQVAAVIVDPTALIRATEAVMALTRQLEDHTEALKDMTKEMIRNGARR